MFEGLSYFLFADKMPELLAMLARQEPRSLRMMGFSAMLIGFMLIWIFKS